MIPAEAHPASGDPTSALDLLHLRWPASLLVTADREELAIDGPHGTIRLSLRQGSLLAGPVALRYILEPPRLAERLAALTRWDIISRSGRLPGRLRPKAANASRWRLVIGALDALAEGCSLRRTAMRLFGAERTERDWDDRSDYLKLRTRRLVTQARHLVAGGYRALL